MVRVVLLASMIGLLAGAAAPARDLLRDLPRRKEAPRATGCDLYGPGFVKVEGTDTCVKLTGDVRAEVRFHW